MVALQFSASTIPIDYPRVGFPIGFSIACFMLSRTISDQVDSAILQ
jgi:hypothetical protein